MRGKGECRGYRVEVASRDIIPDESDLIANRFIAGPRYCPNDMAAMARRSSSQHSNESTGRIACELNSNHPCFPSGCKMEMTPKTG